MSKIRIAVIGGGIGGACIANALLNIPHIDFDVYEAGPEFTQRGAAIGLAVNAQKALDQIVGSAKDLLHEAGGVPMNRVRGMMGTGPSMGQVIFERAQDFQGAVVHRASLLRALLAPIPPSSLHTNKKLERLVTSGEQVHVHFQDGTSETFDGVIGADGIFSTVRCHVLQDEADLHAAQPAGFWDTRALIPIEKARQLLPAEFVDPPSQHLWSGDGVIIMHDVLEHGTLMQCIISAMDPDPSADRKMELSRPILNKIFASWLDGPIANQIIDITLDDDHPYGYSQWEHKSTPTYANGNVCIAGDAAHASSPWQGSGASLAMEDAMILGTLLQNVTSPSHLEAAFKAFDQVRRERCQQVIDSSRGTGVIFCGGDPTCALQPDKLAAALGPRWDFILALDMVTHKKEALDIYNSLRG